MRELTHLDVYANSIRTRVNVKYCHIARELSMRNLGGLERQGGGKNWEVSADGT